MEERNKELAKRARYMFAFQATVETIAKELGCSVRQVTFWLIEAGMIPSNQPPLKNKETKPQIVQEIECILGLEGKLSSFEKVDKQALLDCRNMLVELSRAPVSNVFTNLFQ